MVTKRQLNSLKREVSAFVNQASNIVKENEEKNEEDRVNLAVVMKEDLQVSLNKYQEDLYKFEETLEENDESEKIVEIYERVIFEGKLLLNQLSGLINGHNQKKQQQAEQEEKQRQAEEREKQRQAEAVEKEQQRLYELEILKLQAVEKEKDRELTLRMEQLKIDSEERMLKTKAEENVKIEQINVEKMKLEAENKPFQSDISENKSKSAAIRLPKLELKKFDGDILKWQEFWDTFESTIHNNPNLQKVDKFKYLKAQLNGRAADILSGLQITNENYDIAINLVTERYGKQDIIADAHFAKLSNIPAPTYKTTSLRIFYDEVEKHIRVLKSLGEDISKSDMVALRSKLPRSVLLRLADLKTEGEPWTMENFRTALQKYVNKQEEVEYNIRIFQGQEETRQKQFTAPSYRHSTAEMLFSGERRKTGHKCIFCDGDHWSDECKKYPTITTRKEKVKGRCYVCFSPHHQLRSCNKTKPCYHCKESKLHHRSLCPQKFITTADNSKQNDAQETNLISIGEKIIMQTALAQASNLTGDTLIETRLLLDTGSQRTYITKDLKDKLALEEVGNETLTVYTFGNKKPKEITTSMVDLNLSTRDGQPIKIRASVVPHITGTVQRSPVSKEQRSVLEKQFKLSDTLPTAVQTSQLGILLGNDYYHDIVLPDRRKIDEGLYVINSKLGWILCGRTVDNSIKNCDTESSMFVMTNSNSKITSDITRTSLMDTCCQNFEPDIEDFWKIDTLGIKAADESEENILDNFKSTIVNQDGRYHVTWPWKDEVPDLPENYELCNGRLKSLYKRLADQPEILRRYNEIIKDQLNKGIIEKAPIVKEGRSHYIPHHAIVNEEKDKIRIVYDASSKTKKSNKSLNDCLYRGPVILEDLTGLLMRFRMKKIGIIADIEKAFLQVSLQHPDRDVTRFLWLKDVNQAPSPTNIETYRFTRVPFGIVSSPFLLAATIIHHLERDGSSTALQIKENLYVDNLISGTNDLQEAQQFYTKAKQIFREAKMNLRDWKSNAEEFNNALPKDDKIPEKNTKVLGVTWQTQKDELQVSTRRFDSIELATTKRGVLTTIASLFDPLGLLSPASIKMKLFLQELWVNGYQWDDEMSDILKDKWRSITEEMANLQNLTVPRYIGNTASELFCFSDASGNAYATAIYLRTIKDGKPSVNLVFAKSRVAPKKMLSIPRLELLSVLIGVRSLQFVKNQLQISNIKCTLWSDSMCVLSWIKGAKTTSVFVNNRIKEICMSKDVVFKYINTKENPADLPTRGLSSTLLEDCQLWWNGPSWLKNDQSSWPTWNVPEVDLKKIEEETQSSSEVLYEISGISHEPAGKSVQSPFTIDETKYSCLEKLLRITAYVQRFIEKLKGNNTNPTQHLSAEEINKAEVKWIKYIQTKHYITEKGELNQQQKTSQLNPKIHGDGIIRVHGRFDNAELSEESIIPILLPRKEHFTKLFIESEHRRLNHAGTAHTLAQIRHRFWIPQGRTEVKSTLKKCLVCIKSQGGPYKVKPMAPWPKHKVSKSSAFTNTGPDYFGPLYIKRGKDQSKAWVCLFTCIATRAIHLELVEDMTSEQFLLALKRFIARRGKPDQIISDNAPQFKVTKNTLDTVWESVVKDDSIHTFVSSQRIKWSFIIELSPWMGGFYERLVGITKMALKKSIGRLRLTSIQLQTVLTEIEATLNSRPLIYVNDDLNDQFIITPMHFLAINTKNGTPQIGDETELDDPTYNRMPLNSSQQLLETWKRGNRHLEEFWKIWRDQYLLSLRERSQIYNKHSRTQSSQEAKVGDVVQIKESSPRGNWKIGRITELITSQDDLQRAAKVQLSNKNTIQRSLVHLYPLEINDENAIDSQETKKNAPETNEKVTQKNDSLRPKRKAATDARDKILGHLIEN